MKAYFTVLLVLGLNVVGAPNEQPKKGEAEKMVLEKAPSTPEHEARMQWWREAKFGMFIHWGVYSVPAGYYKEKPVPNLKIAEWIMNNAKIPVAEYKEYAKQFNPVQFNAEEWVKIAKDAGMKYIVITSKHHDGFAMYGSGVSDWNICEASPFGRDVLKELADACRKHGMRLGFYYSQTQDWVNGGSAYGGKWDKAQERDMDEYIDNLAVPQVKELLTKYGNDVPAVIWWDIPVDNTKERSEKLYKTVRGLNPKVIMNNRLGVGFPGDMMTREQHIPAPDKLDGGDWENCMTMNKSWGYKRDDDNWKTAETLIHYLCDITSKGGNYLLNVGPTAEGVIPPESIERLKQVGEWMKVNGEAIYGCGPTPFGKEWGIYSKTEKNKKGHFLFDSAWDWRCTTTQPGKLYIHLLKWPGNHFVVPPVKSKITSVYLLADPERKPVVFKQTNEGITLTLPETAPGKYVSVICLESVDTEIKVE